MAEYLTMDKVWPQTGGLTLAALSLAAAIWSHLASQFCQLAAWRRDQQGLASDELGANLEFEIAKFERQKHALQSALAADCGLG